MQDRRGRPLYGTVEDIAARSAELPGVWKNKKTPGYRVPFNLYNSLDWSPPANQGSEASVLKLLQSPLLHPGLDTYATAYQKRLLRKLACCCWVRIQGSSRLSLMSSTSQPGRP